MKFSRNGTSSLEAQELAAAVKQFADETHSPDCGYWAEFCDLPKQPCDCGVEIEFKSTPKRGAT